MLNGKFVVKQLFYAIILILVFIGLILLADRIGFETTLLFNASTLVGLVLGWCLSNVTRWLVEYRTIERHHNERKHQLEKALNNE